MNAKALRQEQACSKRKEKMNNIQITLKGRWETDQKGLVNLNKAYEFYLKGDCKQPENF